MILTYLVSLLADMILKSNNIKCACRYTHGVNIEYCFNMLDERLWQESNAILVLNAFQYRRRNGTVAASYRNQFTLDIVHYLNHEIHFKTDFGLKIDWGVQN